MACRDRIRPGGTHGRASSRGPSSRRPRPTRSFWSTRRTSRRTPGAKTHTGPSTRCSSRRTPGHSSRISSVSRSTRREFPGSAPATRSNSCPRRSWTASPSCGSHPWIRRRRGPSPPATTKQPTPSGTGSPTSAKRWRVPDPATRRGRLSDPHLGGRSTGPWCLTPTCPITRSRTSDPTEPLCVDPVMFRDRRWKRHWMHPRSVWIGLGRLPVHRSIQKAR